MKAPATSAAFVHVMEPSNSKAASSPAKEASLHQFENFHGMLCSPSTASDCIDSFDGAILIMPSTYTPQNVRAFDVSARGVLTVFSYYLLVLVSLTGLSTLLGMTDFRMAMQVPSDDKMKEEAQADQLTSTYNDKLRVEDHVLDYCKRQTNAKAIYLKRRFEYKFLLGELEVVMLHFQCDQNKLHIVEVYHFGNWFWQDYLVPLWQSVGKWFRKTVLARRQQESVKKE